MTIQRRAEEGFTLVELLIALTVFTSLLIVITTSFVNLLRLQTATIAARNTQQAARYAMEEMVRTARGAVDTSTATVPGTSAVCFWSSTGNGRAYFVSSQKLYAYDYKDAPTSNCDVDATTPPAAKRLITTDDAQVLKFETSATTTKPQVANLTLALVSSTAETGQVTASDCRATSSKLNACSIAELSSSATLRGNQ